LEIEAQRVIASQAKGGGVGAGEAVGTAAIAIESDDIGDVEVGGTGRWTLIAQEIIILGASKAISGSAGAGGARLRAGCASVA
jgi:hypothetical protein